MSLSKNRQFFSGALVIVFMLFTTSACSVPGQLESSSDDNVASTSNPNSDHQSSDAGSSSPPTLTIDSSGPFSVDLANYAVKQPEEVELNGSLPYTERDPMLLKAIQTDGWHRQKFINANIGGVAINFVWQQWQPEKANGKCDKGQITFDKHCFSPQSKTDEDVKFWSSNGVAVTAILWGVPEWARIKESCRMPTKAINHFCANINPADFGRFAGMLAERYNGRNNKGRIADFVIHNEVNMAVWFNPGCGQGVACDIDNWVDTYAVDYNAAYDSIKAQQPAAKVFISFAHQFGSALDKPAADQPVISVQTFLTRFNLAAMGRKWRVAYHPYNKHPAKPQFSTDDLPYVSFGNIGILAGWLRTTFPDQPEAWEIHLTESGFNSLKTNSSEQAQAQALCDSFRNVIGTPGIENYVYHRMQDHPVEIAQGGGFGLYTQNSAEKQAWRVWAGANGGNGQALDCGFEHLPYTKLTQYTHDILSSRISSRITSADYRSGESWHLLREYKPGTVMLYECERDGGSYVSLNATCGGGLNLGPVGYSFAEQQQQTIPLFACQSGNNVYGSSDEMCEQGEIREFLGYVYR